MSEQDYQTRQHPLAVCAQCGEEFEEADYCPSCRSPYSERAVREIRRRSERPQKRRKDPPASVDPSPADLDPEAARAGRESAASRRNRGTLEADMKRARKAKAAKQRERREFKQRRAGELLDQGLSQREVARRLGVGESTIRRWRRSERRVQSGAPVQSGAVRHSEPARADPPQRSRSRSRSRVQSGAPGRAAAEPSALDSLNGSGSRAETARRRALELEVLAELFELVDGAAEQRERLEATMTVSSPSSSQRRRADHR